MGERVMPGEAEQHAERSRRDLGIQPTARRVGGRRDVQLFAPQFRRGVHLDHPERDRPVDLSAQALHPVQFLLGRDDVLACHSLRSQLEDGLAAGRHGPAEPEQLVLGGIGSRNRLAVDGAVTDGARGRKAQRAGLDRFLHQARHRRNVVR
jgi:hypothetical protein